MGLDRTYQPHGQVGLEATPGSSRASLGAN
jgi:hypothetical protein